MKDKVGAKYLREDATTTTTTTTTAAATTTTCFLFPLLWSQRAGASRCGVHRPAGHLQAARGAVSSRGVSAAVTLTTMLGVAKI